MTRGLSWKRGGPGIYWARLGDGRVAHIELRGRDWHVWTQRGLGYTLEHAKAATLRGAQAWAERRRAAA